MKLHRRRGPRAGTSGGTTVVSIFLVVWAVIGVSMYVQSRPATIVAGANGLAIDVPARRDTLVLWSAVRAVRLAPELPSVHRPRAMPFGQGRYGTFRLREGGEAQLYIRLGRPPYIAIETDQGEVWLNVDDAAQTRALYDEIRERLSGSVAEAHALR